ncbi:DNA repair protein rad51c [Chytriomyces hyalinus]|nr:DNA repair protein rad51c [Chytriomyces hyalinus]
MVPAGPVARPLATFTMDPDRRALLTNAGVRNSLDVLRVGDGFESVSAWDAMKKEEERIALKTGSQSVDAVIGGGFACGSVSELAGPPGLGKTQFGMQLCINVQLPISQGGADGQAIYIDTEGSFSVKRVAEMAQSAITKMGMTSQVTLEHMLNNIKLFRVHDHIQQIALLNQLENVLSKAPRIKLIVLDSIAFHFRFGFGDMGLRSRLLTSSAQILRKLAGTYSVCILVINQMTTKIIKVGLEDCSALVPALGDSWGHACTSRLILYMQNNTRHAMLVKSPNLPEAVAEYAISEGGIQDVSQE